MKTTTLEYMGLTKAQIDVYFTLCELGEATTGPIIKKSKHQNSVVYSSLNALLHKGLVSFIIKGKRKHYYATDPKNLLDIYEENKSQLTKIVQELQKKRSVKKVKQESKVFLGWKGVYTAFNFILDNLENGGDYIAFGAGFEEQYTEEAKRFFREYQKKRAQKKFKIKIIVNETARKQVQQYYWYKKFGRPTFRYVPGFAPGGLVIVGDHVLNVAFEETPIAVIITSKQIAESHRKAFYAMWKQGKK